MLSELRNRRGVAGTWVAVTLIALLGMAALVIDVGKLTIAAQRAQDMADCAALAGATRLPYTDVARATALRTMLSNNTEGVGMTSYCSSEDVTFYYPNDDVPDYGALGQWAHAITVTARVPVEYGFAKVVGISGAVAERSCTVMRAPARGVPICTMWISHATDLNYGVSQNMFAADSALAADVPGSFGWLASPEGCTATWSALLQGYPLTYEDVETAFVNVGDPVFATTGVDVGTLRKALVDNAGTSRLERGTTGKWEFDTFEDHQLDNPRVMLIPMVTYQGGTGVGAEFRIENFGAFWLDSVAPPQKIITGRFIEFDMPGGDANSNAQFNGIFSTKMLN